MKELLFIFFFFNCYKSSFIFATIQEPDYLIFNGDTLAIQEYPLENYFENHNRPDSLLSFQSTANYRGYVGYWTIKNDKLFLEKLIRQNDEEINLSEIFKDRDTSNLIFADWYNNSLVSYYGKVIYPKYDKIGPIYEFERQIDFKNGVMTNEFLFDNSKTKISNYSTNWNLLFEFISENIDYSNISTSNKNRKVYVIIDSVSIDGKIKKVKIMKGIDDELNTEAIRVLKKIPEWSVYYKHGKQVYSEMVIPVLFRNNNN